jgi:transcriptional regulator with XRE-family HTH domain
MDRVHPATTYLAVLGQVFKHYREKMKLEQRDIAAAVDVQQPYWSKIELGRGNVSVLQLARACAKMNVAPSVVLSDVERSCANMQARGVVIYEGVGEPEHSPGLAFIGGAAIATLLVLAGRK